MRNFLTNKQKSQKSIAIVMSFLLMMCFSMAYGQTSTVTGTVTDGGTGETLIGVNVSVKGTTTGSITDIDGKYSIANVPSSAVLVFSYIGYITQEISVGNQRVINVSLNEDTQRLEEVIVVGYGTRKAGEMTGSVATVKSGEIQKLAAVSTNEVLRNVPGVTVLQSNVPGETPNVIVRGVGTINNAGPLWVVDGVPGGNVNPNDIETITVLKDAAAQAIYGTRAANGVILVTTKAGKKNQKASLTVNIRAGNNRNTNNYKMLNTREYGEALWLEAKNMKRTDYSHPIYGNGAEPRIPDYIYPNGAMEGDPGTDPSLYDYFTAKEDGDDTYLITKANKEGTNWVDEISRVAKYQEYSIDLNGGSDNTTYSFGAGYLDNEGINKYVSYDRWNFRSNITSDVTKWLQIGEMISGTYSNQHGHTNNNEEGSAISWAYRNQPIIPVYDIMGNFAGTRAGGQLGNAQNPLAVLFNNQYDNRERMNLTATGFATLKPIEGLSIRTQFGMNYNTLLYKNIDYVNKSHAERGTDDYMYMTHDRAKRWTWTNMITYQTTIGLNDITVMAATEAIDDIFYRTTAQRYNYSSKDPDYIELSSGIDGQQNGSEKRSWSMFSVFGRVNYVFDSKYMFEGVVRRDGSSRFAEGNRYGVFPAFSVGWVISKESFMASTKTWLQNLKLRGGYGVTGNDQMDDYNSYTTYLFQQNDESGSFYAINGANGSAGNLGFRQGRIGNIDVKWETTHTTDVGIDAAFLSGFTLSFDVYQRRTTDMLFPKAVPSVFGRATVPSVNVGEMLNTGFDFDLGYRGTAMNRELNYSVNFNISHYKNEVVTLTGNDNEFLDGSAQREQIYTRSQKGHAFPEFYGYVVEGIFQTQAEADAHPVAFGDKSYSVPGHYKFKDVDGNGVINVDDRTWIGSPHPKFTGGLIFDVSYKGFDLNGQFYGTYGNKMVNYVNRWLNYYQFDGGRGHDYLYSSWGSPYLNGDNTQASLPMIDRNTIVQRPSTAFIEDASYLRLRNLQLGYDITKIMTIPTVKALRVFLQVTNLFTITGYSGLDPDTSRGGDRDSARNFGIDAGATPTPRQILFGLTLGL
ncbi:MAG: TonB-dependent receptor [Tannerella sp.]|jgi:TonB-linked SusC/RagA family outer membrane protein|nr:TonB-dependent receptor [Tannerella sp.]